MTRGSVVELQCASAARSANERKTKTGSALETHAVCLLHGPTSHPSHHYYLSGSTASSEYNDDQLLEQHLTHGPANVQYTSKFAPTSLIETMDTWLESKLTEGLKKSPFFSILHVADEFEDVSTQGEFLICCRWVVNGQAEGHFLAILHIPSCDAATIVYVLEALLPLSNLTIANR